jgi:type II secretory pathway predicted ATPase ExeA/predicted nuclease with TOPRIM domain
MYLKYFNLNTKPFEISPDPRFLWVGEKHKEGFAALKYAILTGKGFISLTGDVGTGKTTLLNALVRSFDDNYIFARIPDPSLEELDFFNITASAFEMNKRFSGKGEFLSELSTFLNNSYANNKEAILIIDEAQRIRPELLEEIRLISNIEKPDKKLITIIFAGQSNFNEILNNNKALRNRLAFNYKIEPLTEIETEKYITHRLKVAGSEFRIFSSSAIHEIYSFSKGNPRQINIICDLALLYGYSADTRVIEPAIIRECLERTSIPFIRIEPLPEKLKITTKIPRKSIQEKPPENLSQSWKRPIPAIKTTVSRHKTAYLAPVSLIILVFIVGFIYYGGSSNSSILKLRTFIDQAKSSYAKPLYEAFLQNAQVVKVQTPLPAEKKADALRKNLNQERNSDGKLTSELAAQAALIADLQKRLQASQADQAGLAGQVEEGRQAAAQLKLQLEALAAQKTSSDSRFEKLQTAYNALTADLEELKHRSEKAADLETALVVKDRELTQRELQQQELEKNLAQVKDGKVKLDGEFAAQAALIADLQKRLQASQTDQAGLAGQVDESRQAAAQLKMQLEALAAQKTSSESRFEKLQSAYNALTADFEELKHRGEKAADLETALAAKDRELAQRELQQQELEKNLAQVKDGKDKLDGEFAAQAALIADLQKRLQASQTDQAALEVEYNKNRKRTAQLQAQVEELKAKTSASSNKPAAFDALPKPASDMQLPEEETKSRNPADIIDWVIKKKSQ